MSYRRDQSIRNLYEQFIDRTQQASYQKVNVMDRRPAFSCTEDDCERGSGYDHSQSGGGYHGDNQGGYHGERALYSGERSGPLYRREDPYSYRESAGQRSAARQAELRNSARVTSQTNIKGQRLPPPWSLSISVCHRGDDCVSRTITSTGRREECEALKRKVSFPPVREHSPVKREVPHSPQNRSSRSFTPDSGKASHPYPSQPKKSPFPQVSSPNLSSRISNSCIKAELK